MSRSIDLRARLGALRADDVRRLDASATAAGVSTVQLMEVAGFQVARVVGRRTGRVLVLAGRGNNGGDGLVAARHCAAWGVDVCAVVVAADEAVDGLLADQVRAARGAGVEVVCTLETHEVLSRCDGAELVVDALLGTGLRSAPREPVAAVLRGLAGRQILAVDVPSGVDADTGGTPGAAVTAQTTVTLTACKAGLWTGEGRRRSGRLYVADIGMPATAWRACGLQAPSEVAGGGIVEVPTCD